MTISRRIAEYQELRSGPVWTLLAADTAPFVLSILETRFPPGDRVFSSAALESVRQDLEDLNLVGEIMDRPAQFYLSEWVKKGYLDLRLYPGETEECYELSASATSALRFLSSLSRPRASATESRLSAVLQLAKNLSDDTDPNPESRLATLHAERDAIDLRIAEIGKSGISTIEDDRALERAREIISLSADLIEDFTRVRAEFENLNRNLRKSIAESEGHRGMVLETLFSGLDLIAESDAGRTFNAFWRMLMDRKQHGILDEFVTSVLDRSFAKNLTSDERYFLEDISRALLERGGSVHLIQERFARSLSDFIRTKEYLEHRRISTLLRQTTALAITASQRANARTSSGFSLEMTSASIRSLDQWLLKNPSFGYERKAIITAPDLEVRLEDIAEEIGLSEIDYRVLKEHIQDFLADHNQATVSDLIARYGTKQGLGTILGYMDLAYHSGERASETENVSWLGHDGISRSATIPLLYFLKERINEL